MTIFFSALAVFVGFVCAGVVLNTQLCGLGFSLFFSDGSKEDRELVVSSRNQSLGLLCFFGCLALAGGEFLWFLVGALLVPLMFFISLI